MRNGSLAGRISGDTKSDGRDYLALCLLAIVTRRRLCSSGGSPNDQGQAAEAIVQAISAGYAGL